MSFPQFGPRPVPQPKKPSESVEVINCFDTSDGGAELGPVSAVSLSETSTTGVEPCSSELAEPDRRPAQLPPANTENADRQVTESSMAPDDDRPLLPSYSDDLGAPAIEVFASAEDHDSPTIGRSGRPLQSPRPASSSDSTSQSKPYQPLKQDDFDADQASIGDDGWPLFNLVHRMLGPVVISAFIGLGGVLVLYVYCQILAAISSLAAMPQWMAIPAIALLGLLVSLIVLAIGRLVAVYLRLQRNRQVRLKDLERLAQRATMRRIVHERRREARKILEEYVSTYPVPECAAQGGLSKSAQTQDRPAPGRSLGDLMTQKQRDRLAKARRQLTARDGRATHSQWLEEYNRLFQVVLDEAADARVNECAGWVAVKTAISPSSLVDTLVASYWAFVLLHDLCLIYNVRVGAVGTTALLARVFFNAYVAGRLEGWEEHVEETYRQVIGGILHGVGQKVVAKFAAKGSIGLANFILITRLGRRAILALKPLA